MLGSASRYDMHVTASAKNSLARAVGADMDVSPLTSPRPGPVHPQYCP